MDNPFDIFGWLLVVLALLLVPVVLVVVWAGMLLAGIIHVVAWVCAIVSRRAEDAAGTAGGL